MGYFTGELWWLFIGGFWINSVIDCLCWSEDLCFALSSFEKGNDSSKESPIELGDGVAAVNFNKVGFKLTNFHNRPSFRPASRFGR